MAEDRVPVARFPRDRQAVNTVDRVDHLNGATGDADQRRALGAGCAFNVGQCAAPGAITLARAGHRVTATSANVDRRYELFDIGHEQIEQVRRGRKNNDHADSTFDHYNCQHEVRRLITRARAGDKSSRCRYSIDCRVLQVDDFVGDKLKPGRVPRHDLRSDARLPLDRYQSIARRRNVRKCDEVGYLIADTPDFRVRKLDHIAFVRQITVISLDQRAGLPCDRALGGPGVDAGVGRTAGVLAGSAPSFSPGAAVGFEGAGVCTAAGVEPDEVGTVVVDSAVLVGVASTGAGSVPPEHAATVTVRKAASSTVNTGLGGRGLIIIRQSPIPSLLPL
jgi:hypothetical protein